MEMYTYRYQKRDSLERVVSELYQIEQLGDVRRVVSCACELNGYENESRIPDGAELTLPQVVFHCDESRDVDRYDEYTVVTLRRADVHTAPVFMLNLEGQKQPARRRFVYCYRYEYFGDCWINEGVLLTDDYGRPHRVADLMQAYAKKTVGQALGEEREDLHGLYAKDAKEKDEATTRQDTEAAIDPMSPAAKKPFGFYSPEVTENVSFRGSRGYRLNQGVRYLFIPAPLDTIQACDRPTGDATGFKAPPKHLTNWLYKEKDLDGFWSDPKRLRNCLLTRGQLVDVTPVERVEAVIDVWKEGKLEKQKTKRYEIELKPSLPEYVSLIKKYTYRLQQAIKTDMRLKSGYRDLVAKIQDLCLVLDMMKRYATWDTGDDPEEKQLSAQRRSRWEKDIAAFQQNALRLAKRVEDERIKSRLGYRLELSQEKNKPVWDRRMIHKWLGGAKLEAPGGEAASYAEDPKDFFDLPTAAGKLCGLLMDDAEFQVQLKQYLEWLRDEGYFELQNASDFDGKQTYFSFKHPVKTIMDALEDALLTLAQMPEEGADTGIGSGFDSKSKYPNPVEAVFEGLIEPLMQACAATYDEQPGEMKQVVEEYVENLYGILGSSASFQLSKDISKPAVKHTTEKGILTIIWEIVTHNQVSSFWNDQAGSPSTMTRIVNAYMTRKASKVLAMNIELMKVEQHLFGSYNYLKTLAIQGKYFTRQSINKTAMKDLLDTSDKMINLRTSVDKESLAFERANRIEKAPVAVNAFCSGVQLITSVYGMVQFAQKASSGQKMDKTDYVRLIDSVSNGGLALTGFTPAAWSVAVKYLGAGFAGVASACGAYFASEDYLQHRIKDQDFLASVSFVNAGVCTMASAAWMTSLLGGIASQATPLGWIVLAAGLLKLASSGVYKLWELAQPGTFDYYQTMMEQIRNHPMLSDRIGQKVEQKVKIRKMYPRATVLTDRDEYIRLCDRAVEREYRAQLECMPIQGDWKELMSLLGRRIGRFYPIDPEKGMPLLVRRGFSLEAIQWLMEDGCFVGRDNDELTADVKSRYASVKRKLERNDPKELRQMYLDVFEKGQEQA